MFRKLTTLVRLWARPEAEANAAPMIFGYYRAPTRVFGLIGILILAAACIGYGYAFGVMAPSRMMPFVVPIALIGALILWCLPAGEYAPTGALEPLFIAFFAALILWPNYLAIALGNLPWITMLRLTGTPLIIIFLASISSSASFRAYMMQIITVDKPILWMMIVLIALWTLSLPLSSDLGASINRYVLALVNLVGVFFVSCYLFSRPGFADLWMRLLLLMLGALCLIGIWEFRMQSLPWAGHIPSFLKVDDPTVQGILTPGFNRTAGIYRVKVTATTPLGLGELLGLGMPFAMHYLFGRSSIFLRIAAALFIPLASWVILLTDSRLGFVAGCASVMFYLLMWAVLRWRQNKTSVFAPAIVLSYPVFFAAFMAATFFVGRLRAEFWGTGAQQYSTQGRIDQWAMGLPKILKNPFGYGFGNAAQTLGFSNRGGMMTIDSYWLSVLLEIGVVGFIVFYGVMLRGAFIAAKSAVQTEAQREFGLLIPLAVSLVNFFIVKMVFSQDANHPLIFMMLGGVVALTWRAHQYMNDMQAAPTPPATVAPHGPAKIPAFATVFRR